MDIILLLCDAFVSLRTLELEFPSSLTSEERKYIHLVAQQLGLKSKSRGWVTLL